MLGRLADLGFLRYVGTKLFKQAGFTLDFDIRLHLESETRMTGTLRAKPRAGEPPAPSDAPSR